MHGSFKLVEAKLDKTGHIYKSEPLHGLVQLISSLPLGVTESRLLWQPKSSPPLHPQGLVFLAFSLSNPSNPHIPQLLSGGHQNIGQLLFGTDQSVWKSFVLLMLTIMFYATGWIFCFNVDFVNADGLMVFFMMAVLIFMLDVVSRTSF